MVSLFNALLKEGIGNGGSGGHTAIKEQCPDRIFAHVSECKRNVPIKFVVAARNRVFAETTMFGALIHLEGGTCVAFVVRNGFARGAKVGRTPAKQKYDQKECKVTKSFNSLGASYPVLQKMCK